MGYGATGNTPLRTCDINSSSGGEFVIPAFGGAVSNLSCLRILRKEKKVPGHKSGHRVIGASGHLKKNRRLDALHLDRIHF
jgi:hypothetical protein